MLAQWARVDDDAAQRAFGGGINPALADEIAEIPASTMFYVRLFRHYEAGHLWMAGGVADQPSRYLDAMEVLGSEINRIRTAEATKQRARSSEGFANTGTAKLKISRK